MTIIKDIRKTYSWWILASSARMTEGGEQGLQKHSPVITHLIRGSKFFKNFSRRLQIENAAIVGRKLKNDFFTCILSKYL